MIAKFVRHMQLLMTAVAVTTYAQSVLGIKIGESYSNAKNTLRERYGYKLSEDSGNLTLSNFEMGDFSFDYGTLFFQWVDGMDYDDGVLEIPHTFREWAEYFATERSVELYDLLVEVKRK